MGSAALPEVVVLCDAYPVATETFVVNELRALRRLGVSVAVEALSRGDVAIEDDVELVVWEEDATARRLASVAALALRHPWRAAADLLARRRWRREEPVPPLRFLAPAARRIAARNQVHLHAHFAAGAALAALRLARILGIPYSITAHGYDIYQRPTNLPEKLRRAVFATSGSAYTVAELRRVAGPQARVEEVVMGIDGEHFRRTRPHPAGRVVVAVGRLVEKKGFADLVEAVALLRERGAAPERVVIAGDGPLRAALGAEAERRDIADLVELPGALRHEAVRDLLEDAAVLCMPCVIAADGDRDSMPVVVKEALAMEVPVVATDAVGLPEVVGDDWGRLVPPRDPSALADALAELLGLEPAQRAAMGRAGREHVLRACSVDDETARLAGLIRSTSPRSAVR